MPWWALQKKGCSNVQSITALSDVIHHGCQTSSSQTRHFRSWSLRLSQRRFRHVISSGCACSQNQNRWVTRAGRSRLLFFWGSLWCMGCRRSGLSRNLWDLIAFEAIWQVHVLPECLLTNKRAPTKINTYVSVKYCVNISAWTVFQPIFLCLICTGLIFITYTTKNRMTERYPCHQSNISRDI